ncbi:hypothetical protein MLD38_032913 [Melastoma candidum]|uniref:Uncharacterized protein n=1 Tax=Melastoma candidum TaxID=119954 RepID=A0ACB9M5N3_9MYRT|nr:hypothetical protein MLD38_032913 [Melastoma candidum]
MQMEFPVRARRVTVPLGHAARARLIAPRVDYSSSGSDHDPVDSSPCLSELVHGFFEEDDGGDPRAGSCSGDEPEAEGPDDGTNMDAAKEIVSDALSCDGDPFRAALSACVAKAAGFCSCWRSNKSLMWRQVMLCLRDVGYNAAVCKTKWDASGGLTAGNYEFVDIVRPGGRQLRYFVDLDFRGEFEIARPTDHYSELLAFVPRVFVGCSDDLKKIVRSMCDAGRRSLKSRGLSVPPWRKNRYMQNKWLGPYRRTTNPFPGAPTVAVSSSAYGCLSIGGFEETAGVSGRQFVRMR